MRPQPSGGKVQRDGKGRQGTARGWISDLALVVDVVAMAHVHGSHGSHATEKGISSVKGRVIRKCCPLVFNTLPSCML